MQNEHLSQKSASGAQPSSEYKFLNLWTVFWCIVSYFDSPLLCILPLSEDLLTWAGW